MKRYYQQARSLSKRLKSLNVMIRVMGDHPRAVSFAIERQEVESQLRHLNRHILNMEAA